MSAWKWQQVFAGAKRLHIAPLLYDGVQACKDQFFMQLTDELNNEWAQHTLQAEKRQGTAASEVAELLFQLGQLQLRPILMEPWTAASFYDCPSHHCTTLVSIYYPYSTQGQKADDWARNNGQQIETPQSHLLHYEWKSLRVEHRHRMLSLNNKLNDITLQNILSKEWLDGGTSHVTIQGQRIETIGPTLHLLINLLSIIKTTLNEGLTLWQIVDLGILLRRQGDRVDFVKLQNWIERLHFTRMAQLIGMVLTGLLGFSIDEVPFMQSAPTESDVNSFANDLLQASEHNGAPKYLRYCPGESLSSVVASITHSLGNVEE